MCRRRGGGVGVRPSPHRPDVNVCLDRRSRRRGRTYVELGAGLTSNGAPDLRRSRRRRSASAAPVLLDDGRDTAEMRLRCSADAPEIQRSCAAEIQRRCCLPRYIQHRSICSRDAAEIHSRYASWRRPPSHACHAIPTCQWCCCSACVAHVSPARPIVHATIFEELTDALMNNTHTQ